MTASGHVPAGSLVLTRLPGRATAPDAAQVMRLFPPRPAGTSWPATGHPREQVLTRLLAPPFALDNPAGQAQRRPRPDAAAGLAGQPARPDLAGPLAGLRG